MRIWAKSKLDVTFSNHTNVPDDLDRGSPQHVVLVVAQCLTGSNNNGFSSVDSQWINILHVTHGEAIVVGIPDHLILHFFPSLHRFIDQQLAGLSKGCGGKFN